MNLHRINKQTEWGSLKPHDRNRWQHIAVATRGIMTPGNVLTITGLLLVFYGLWHIVSGNIWVGVWSLIAGRLCDIADGLVAEATATKSFLGEVLDATADKIAILITILVMGVVGVMPWLILGGLLLPHILIPVIIYVKRRRGQVTHPSYVGKLSMAALWLSVIGYLFGHGLAEGLPTLSLIVVSTITTFAIISGWYAAIGYLKNPAKL